MKKLIFIIFISIIGNMQASEWQWSVKIRDYVSPETNACPEAFLWIPSDCEQIRAVVVGQHNMCEEPIFEHPTFRKTMTDLGFAIIWITPGIDQAWNIKNGCQKYFDTILDDLADISGYSELSNAPIVPLGHSAMATFPWNFAAWNPDRTLAVVSYKGDAPRTNLTGYGRDNLEWGRTRNIDGIPGLMIQGEYEWWEARVNPALAFRMMYPESCISFLCDAGHGHFDVSDEVINYISLFLRKAAQYRLPEKQPLDKSAQLRKVDIKKGWLAECWRPDYIKRAQTTPFPKYKGDSHDAFWYFDKEMADQTEEYYANERNKKNQYIGFTQNGKFINYQNTHAGYSTKFEPENDGMTFHISPLFVDSSRIQPSVKQSFNENIKIDRICGPVEKVNDTTFTVRFYRMGLNNQKKTNDIWLLAHHTGDKEYKSAVQQINIKIPYPNKEGKKQIIEFEPIKSIHRDSKPIKLNAVSDSGLPVYYYVKEGPVKIEDNKLVVTEIPPRAKYPVKVTVVAWQYGRNSGVKVQTAKPVERSFYIEY